MPLRNSRAAKLRVVLEGAKTSRLPAMVAASDRRIEQIEGEQRAWVGDNAAALALREWRRGFEAVARVRALAREMFAAVSEAQHGYHVLMSIVSGTSGSPLDGRLIEVDARRHRPERELRRATEPPRVRAFTPHPGKHVTVVPTRDGGWVHAQYADRAKAGLAPEPERVERPT